MFVGQFYHTLDEKGRLTIPVRFREALKSGAMLVRGFDENLMVLTATEFEKVSNRLMRMNIADPTTRLLYRLIFSTAAPIELDKLGRILIPQTLREAAKLKDEVVVAGAGMAIEIWAAELWETQLAMLRDAEANSHRFAALDLSSA